MRKRNFFALFLQNRPYRYLQGRKIFQEILGVSVKIGRKHRPVRKRLHPVAILQG